MADVAPIVSFKKRTTKSAARKRPATPPPTNDHSSSDSDSYTTNDDEQTGARIKRRKKSGITTSTTTTNTTNAPSDLRKSTAYAADRSTTISANDDATRTSNWSAEAARAVDAAKISARANASNDPDERQDGTYKGTSKYSTFIAKPAEPTAQARAVGPVKAPTNVRMITTTDFAPDVCKDYKQTGFCGFGDSCKFLHTREDYKQGWQLDKEWEKVGANNGKDKKPAKPVEDDGDDEEKMLEKIPFKCVICKEDYKRPVVTRCGHYFCEKCAMTRYMKEKRKTCLQCGADTHGTFNVARKLNELLERKRKRLEAKREEARANGEEVDDGGDDE